MEEKELRIGVSELSLLMDCAQLVKIAQGSNTALEKLVKNVDRPEDYETLYLLAKGGHSEVFVVRSIKTKRIFALKKVQKIHILQDPLANPVMKERESMISGRNSTWLLGLHKSFQDESFLYFLTDFISGGDLGSLCCRVGNLSESWIRFFAGEILMGLQELHALGMIHRDIKPENVLIDSEGHIRLADFGSATAIDGEDHEIVVGTPDYVAPELLLMEKKRISPKVDIWALGVVIYELKFGTTPFYEESVRETYRRIMKLEYRVEGCSRELESLLKKMLAPEDARIGVEEATKHPFFEGFRFSGKKENIPEHLPAVAKNGSVENFETDDFSPVPAEPPKPLENIQRFAGFGFNPEIAEKIRIEESLLKNQLKNSVRDREEEYVEAREAKQRSEKTVHVGIKFGDVFLEEEKEEGAGGGSVNGSGDGSGDGVGGNGVNDNGNSNGGNGVHGNVIDNNSVIKKCGEIDIVKKAPDGVEKILESKTGPEDKKDVDIAVAPQRQEEFEVIRKITENLEMFEEAMSVAIEGISQVKIARIEKSFEDIKDIGRSAALRSEENRVKEEESHYQTKKLIRKLQIELRETHSRIEREVEIRARLAQQKEELQEENKTLREQMRRLKLGSSIRNFPIKIYQDRKWENCMLCLEEDFIRIKNIKLPLSKTYFQNLKKNELLRMNSKGEALAFKLLLPSEDDAYTEQTESSSEQQISTTDEQELKKELVKEIAIFEGIEKLMAAVTGEAMKAQVLKQKLGTEKKIQEIKQALAQGTTVQPKEQGVIKYNNHTFKLTSFSTALQVWCHECSRPLYGASKQGLMCRGCKIICHKECHTLVEYSCELHQAMERGICVTLMAKHLEDKERIKEILNTAINR